MLICFNPWRKRRSLFLLGFAIIIVTMVMVTMVEKLQEAEMMDAAVSNSFDSHLNKVKKHQRIKSLKVIRETLAVEDDYSDTDSYNDLNRKFHLDNHKRSSTVKMVQPIFNYQKEKIKNKERKRNIKKIKNKIQQRKIHQQPFNKIVSTNGSVMYQVQNTSYSHKNVNHASKIRKGANTKLNVDNKKNYDSYDVERAYSYQYENNIFKENYFDPPPKDTSNKKFKFPFSGKVSLKKQNSSISYKTKMSNNLQANNQKNLIDILTQKENWPNLQQMGVRNNDLKKARQFVRTAAKGNSNIESAHQNLLVGNTDGDHKVKLFQPCKPSDNDCNPDNEVPKQASNITHYNKISQTNSSYLLAKINKQGTPLLVKYKEMSLAHNFTHSNGDSNYQGVNKTQFIPTNKWRIFTNPKKIKHSIKNNKHNNSSHLTAFMINSIDISVQEDNKIETQIPIQSEIGPLVAVEYPATQLQHPNVPQHKVYVQNQDGMPIVIDKIFWSQDAINLVPPGISEEDFKVYLTNVTNQKINVLQPPSWKRCGRPKNQFAMLEGGQKMCVRYREHDNKMVQGEILSFYLSRFLGLDNVPPVILAEVNNKSHQWKMVKDKFSRAGWDQGQIVALIMWIDDLETILGGYRPATKMPTVILQAYENNTTVSYHNGWLSKLSANQLSEIVQWSDLILFDYITGNYDRVASMQDGAQKEQNPQIMHEDMRNLRKNSRNGKLWFIDNESGLFDAYQLIYNYNHPSPFYKFHYIMLQKICIFNRKTVEKIERLAQFSEPHKVLVKYAKMQDPLYHKLIPNPEANHLFQINFHTRLKEIVKWINHCRKLQFTHT